MFSNDLIQRLNGALIIAMFNKKTSKSSVCLRFIQIGLPFASTGQISIRKRSLSKAHFHPLLDAKLGCQKLVLRADLSDAAKYSAVVGIP